MAIGARDEAGGRGGSVGAGASISPPVVPCAFLTGGGMSVVECLPVVHGGISMNSSKVRTRGLQHSQPGYVSQLHMI